MNRVNEFVFYELAMKVHSLVELSDPVKVSEIWLTLWNARQSIDEIYRQRPLNFTTPAALRLYQAITSIIPQKWEDVIGNLPKNDKPEEPIAIWLTNEVQESAREFETVRRTECQMMDTYFISKKGVYSTKDLVENAHHQVPEPSRSMLPEQAKLDFDQAGKCVAFDVPTAAAFHLLRGTEAVIRQYYDLIVPGDKQASIKMRNWGVYLKLLKAHGGEDYVIRILDHMREVYRNPVTHPEENYSDESVQVLFGLSVSAVVLLTKAIRAANAKGGSLNFPVTALSA